MTAAKLPTYTIRKHTYRGQPGYTITGQGRGSGHNVSYFTSTRVAAEAIRDALRHGNYAAADRLLAIDERARKARARK